MAANSLAKLVAFLGVVEVNVAHVNYGLRCKQLKAVDNENTLIGGGGERELNQCNLSTTASSAALQVEAGKDDNS
jgi:hypothetical protein